MSLIDNPENRERIRKGLELYPDDRNWRDDLDPVFIMDMDAMKSYHLEPR